MSDRDLEIEREERAIYIIIMVAISPVIFSALGGHDAELDGGTTLSFLIVALSVIGLASGVRAMRARLPRARVHQRRPQRRAPVTEVWAWYASSGRPSTPPHDRRS